MSDRSFRRSSSGHDALMNFNTAFMTGPLPGSVSARGTGSRPAICRFAPKRGHSDTKCSIVSNEPVTQQGQEVLTVNLTERPFQKIVWNLLFCSATCSTSLVSRSDSLSSSKGRGPHLKNVAYSVQCDDASHLLQSSVHADRRRVSRHSATFT